MKFFKMFLLVSMLTFMFFGIGEAKPAIVTKIIDGDTIKVSMDGVPVKVRLYGVDAPETKQSFGPIAKSFVSSQIAVNSAVDVEPVTLDRYGRTVGIVTYNGKNLHEELLKEGLAWFYPQYCKKDFCSNWRVLEETAKTGRMGLWAEDNPTPPWVFRKK